MNGTSVCRGTLLLILIGQLMLAGPIHAEVVTETVRYEHEGVSLEGYLAHDNSIRDTRPGVMIVHQWRGLGKYEKMRARQLADLGYIAFAADVYGADTRPSTTHEASLASSTFRNNRNLFRRRLAASLEQMKRMEQVNPQHLAAIGYCFGGTGVLELARSGADIDAVVSFHGGLSNPHPQDAASIRSTVQVHHGGEDPHVTPQDVLSLWTEMKQHATVDWEIHVYSDAPHGFTQPGTPAYNKRADGLSWRAMKRLFETVFG